MKTPSLAAIGSLCRGVREMGSMWLVIPGHREAMNPESGDDQHEIPGSR
jgi:hypothetical protein